MAAKVAKWTVLPTALACTSFKVYAATKEESTSLRVKAHQLPLYNAPPPNSKYVEEEPGRLQTGISAIRKTTNHYIKGCKDAYHFVKNGITSSVQFGKDAYLYVKKPPPEFLPKVGMITISGLTGLFLARNGSKFKRIAYPLGLSAMGVSLCYPAQSVIIVKVTGGKIYAASHGTYEAIGSLWGGKHITEVPLAQEKNTEVPLAQEKNTQSQEFSSLISETKPSILEESEVSQEPEKKTKALEMQFHTALTLSKTDSVSSTPDATVPNSRTDVLKPATFKPDPSLMDHGQSNPEDMDMYSTRS